MTYLNLERLKAIDSKTFQETKPYPWINPENFLSTDGYQQLLSTLPDISLFERRFGVKRAHGQQSHDRYTLEYHNQLPLSDPWKDFVAELRSKEYRDFLQRLLRVHSLELTFHWHYTPSGCSVSPHCDAKHKLGSHIFYFNTEKDWQENWGGETVILDDGGKLIRNSAPKFEDFQGATVSQAIGNYSLLFARKDHSWHGVRAIQCPDDSLRKVFIVVINSFTMFDRIQRLFGKTRTDY